MTFSTCFIHSINNNHIGNSEVSFIFSALCYFISSQSFRSYISYSLVFILIFRIRVISNSNAFYHIFHLNFFFFSWRLITLQYCSGFCHTFTWISHGWISSATWQFCHFCLIFCYCCSLILLLPWFSEF